MCVSGCEDLILEGLSVDSLVNILHWSREDHGSSWLHRQALHYLKEEFLQIAHSPVLYELNHTYMLHAVKSDFLQVNNGKLLVIFIIFIRFPVCQYLQEQLNTELMDLL